MSEISTSGCGGGASAGESAQGQCIRMGSLRKDLDMTLTKFYDIAPVR